jgi:hypothetical protein
LPEYERQHYVPRFYLKNFCNLQKKIFCYNKVKGVSFDTTIDNIAVGKFFYAVDGEYKVEIEKGLGRVEQEFFVRPYSELIKMKNFKKLSYALKNDLFVFLSVQLLRTKEFRLQLKDLHEQALATLVKDFYNKPIPEGLKIRISDAYSQLEHISQLDTNNIIEYAKYLFNKKWVVLLNKTRSPLWTSDNPISFYNSFGRSGYNLGIFSPGIEIRFPLNTELLLYSYDPKTHPDTMNKKRMSERDVLLANETQIRNSTQFICSPTSNFEYATEYLRTYPKYKDPDRKRWEIVLFPDRIELGIID